MIQGNTNRGTLLGLATGACLLALTNGAWGATTCDTPLPDDVAVEAPSSDIPAEWAAFSGTWGNGKWAGVLCNTLVVENISKAGNVVAVYSWGTYGQWHIYKGQFRGFGKINANNELNMKFRNGAQATYWIEGDQLKGKYESGFPTRKITLSRK